MKKYLIGIFIGVALTFSLQVNAEEIIKTLIGKQVQGEFQTKVEGVPLNQPAVVIDGTSFLPVRAIGDALNMDVSFNTDLGIELKKKASDPKVVSPVEPKPLTLSEIEGFIGAAKSQDNSYQRWIDIAQENIKETKDKNPKAYEESKAELIKWQDLRARNQSKLSDLEKQKAALQP